MKSSPKTNKNDDDTGLDDDEGGEEPEVIIKEEARFVPLIRPTAAPQIIDLKALKRSSLPQTTPVHAYRSNVSRSTRAAELVVPDLLRRPTSLRAERSSSPSSASREMRTPLLGGEDPEPVPVSGGLTLRHSAVAVVDDMADYEGYELLEEEEDVDVDWDLLDLPEPVLRRLANESRHSLI